MFVVRMEILKALITDPVWDAKLKGAKTMNDAEQVLRNYCTSKGIKVADI